MTEKKRELIKTIAVIPSNFEYIAKTGIINGTLLVEIERVMEAYAAQQSKMPTEDDIGEEVLSKHYETPEENMAFLDGATFVVEWLRNQIEKR